MNLEKQKHLRFFPAGAIFLAGAILCAAFLSAGCEKPRKVEISREQPELLLEILTDLDQKKYGPALPKIRRYQTLDTINPFLNELEELTISNFYVMKVKNLLDNGRFAEADSAMKDSLSKYDLRTGRVELKQFTGRLRDAGRLIDKLGKPMSAATMKQIATELRGTVRDLPDSRNIIDYADRKCAAADELAKLERDRRGLPLYIETLDALGQHKYGKAGTMTALLSLMLPDGKSDPMLQPLLNGGLFEKRDR